MDKKGGGGIYNIKLPYRQITSRKGSFTKINLICADIAQYFDILNSNNMQLNKEDHIKDKTS